ncbi:MAG: exopolysaccharide transport family protein, partial [Prochlorotrichaceae cyanobacterium]
MVARLEPKTTKLTSPPVVSLSNEGGLEVGKVFAALRRNIPLISGITIVMASLGVWKALTDTPIYKASFEILTEPVSLESRIISSTNPDALSNQEDIISVNVDEAKLKLLKSPGILNPIVEDLQTDYPLITYRQILQELTVSPTSPTSQILEVSYTNPNPRLVEAVLTLVEQAYLDFSLEERQSDILRGIAFVDEQLPTLRNQVDRLQSELEILRQTNNLIDPEVQGEQLSQQVAVFVRDQLNTQVELNQARLLSSDLQNQLSTQKDQAVASPLSTDSRYQEIQLELLKLDTQLAQESTLFLESSPEVGVLEEQKANLLPILEREGQRVIREVTSRIRELENRNQSLGNAIQSVNRQIQSLSSATRQYNEIQRDLTIATNNLDQFLSKREALRLDAAQRQAPWQLLREPSEPQVSAASASRNLALGTAIGLLLGMLAALARDRFSSLVYTAKEIEGIFQVPIIGLIPRHPDADAAIASISLQGMFKHPAAEQLLGQLHQKRLDSHDFIPFTEAFRSLYTNIVLINPDERIHSLTISSATPNEGKTTTSIELGFAAAA